MGSAILAEDLEKTSELRGLVAGHRPAVSA
jgi:hypothetical protein